MQEREREREREIDRYTRTEKRNCEASNGERASPATKSRREHATEPTSARVSLAEDRTDGMCNRTGVSDGEPNCDPGGQGCYKDHVDGVPTDIHKDRPIEVTITEGRSVGVLISLMDGMHGARPGFENAAGFVFDGRDVFDTSQATGQVEVRTAAAGANYFGRSTGLADKLISEITEDDLKTGRMDCVRAQQKENWFNQRAIHAQNRAQGQGVVYGESQGMRPREGGYIARESIASKARAREPAARTAPRAAASSAAPPRPPCDAMAAGVARGR